MIHLIKAHHDTLTNTTIERDCYVISSGGMWLPGTYDSERAAKYAFRFPDDVLARLRDVANAADREITFADLQAEHKRTKAAEAN